MVRSHSRGMLYTAPPETDANRDRESAADANHATDTPVAASDQTNSEHSNAPAPADD